MSLLLLFHNQGVAGAGTLTITDTDILQKPVDYVLAGQQPYESSGREWDIRPMNLREKVRSRTAGPRRLGGDKPSFTTTTTKKGYD